MSCSDTISKSIKKNRKKSPIFESFYFPISQHFSECNGVSRASSDHIIYFDKNEVGTKLLICQIMIVNKVPIFLHFFTNILLKILASV